MKHRVAGRKLGRTSAHRLSMLRNLSTALFDRERITTTLGRAKELRPFAEHLVTLSKRETLHARRLVLRHIRDKAVVSKLFDTLSARFAQRPGGYTRIIKLGPRRGDTAEMAIVELVGSEHLFTKKKEPEKGKTKARAAVPEGTESKGPSQDAPAAPETPKKSRREASAKKETGPKRSAAKKDKTSKAPTKKKAKEEGRKAGKAARKASKKSK